MALHLPGTSV
jgi:hypothetical protein